MDVLLNFLPLKSGGGLQVGLDFLEQARRAPPGHRWLLVATEGTPLATTPDSDAVRLIQVVPRGTSARLWFESIACRRLLQQYGPAVIYTQFGTQWAAAAQSINVVGCAYSNLCYPELDFWGKLPPMERSLRALRDAHRRRCLRQADAVIFETDDLAERGIRHLGLNRDRVHVVSPSASSLVGEQTQHAGTRERCQALPKRFRVLLLSVYHPNKNFELLPRIAQELRARQIEDDTVFVVTLPQASPQWQALEAAADALGVPDRLFNFGPVPQAGCAELYRACDAVILPSRLESFSNTIAESWTLGRALLISELPWARSLCGPGAAYFTYDCATSAADRILELKADRGLRAELVAAGRAQLAGYPSAAQRFEQYVSILERHAGR